MDIKSMIDPNLVRFSLESGTKEAAIEAIINLIDEGGYLLDKAEYVKDIYSREGETATGMGMGLAIPHARSKGVKKSCFTLIHLKEPIEWESLDDKPIEYIIMLAVPANETKEFLNLLSNLSMKLMDDNFRKELYEATNMEEIYTAFTN